MAWLASWVWSIKPHYSNFCTPKLLKSYSREKIIVKRSNKALWIASGLEIMVVIVWILTVKCCSCITESPSRKKQKKKSINRYKTSYDRFSDITHPGLLRYPNKYKNYTLQTPTEY